MTIEHISDFIFTLDTILDTTRKRQLVGGMLLSASLLCGGLAFTMMRIDVKERKHEQL